jgi:large subunit ribosomal protein L15
MAFNAGTSVTPQLLIEKGLVKMGESVKVLGEGDCKVSLNVKAHAFSASALEKIKAAGGTTEVL